MQMTCNGLRLSYEQQGAGSHVTFVHGLTASSRVWHNQVESLSRTHQVLTYDLRGHGESEKPADGSLHFESHVEDLSALLGQLGVQRTTLVGWSFGASVAAIFAAMHPERVERLVLLGATPMLVARPDFPDAVPPEEQAALLGMLEQDFNGTMRAFGAMMMPEPHAPALDALLHGMALQAGKETFVTTLRQAASVDLRPVFAEVAVPTLLLHGSRDALCQPAAARYLAGHIRGARLQLLEDAGHALLLTRAEAVTTAIATFLEG